MKRTVRYITIALLAMMPLAAAAQGSGQGQQQQPKDAATMAAESADYLQKFLNLEDYQVFLVDSTLQFNYDGLMKEGDAIRRRGALNSDLYQMATDRWYEANDTTFIKIFTPEQWKKYLRTDFGKMKKARDKRIAKKAGKK